MAQSAWDEACSEAFFRLRLGRDRRPPPVLYHYTSTEGFASIVKTSKLHASHVRFMADASEIAYGRRLLHQALVTHAAEWGPQRLDDLEATILMFSQAEEETPTPVYATAFSAVDDDAAQWDRYAAGARGYCVGFDSSSLTVGMQRAGQPGIHNRAILYPVTYDRGEQEKRMREIVLAAVRLIEKFGWGEGPQVEQSRVAGLAHAMAWPVLNLLATFKQHAYRSEQEWRLVFTDGPHVIRANLDADFRVSERGLVPYIELEPAEPERDGPLPLRHVVVGPRQPPREAVAATLGFLSRHGYKAYAHEHVPELRKRLGERFTAEPVGVQASSLVLR